MNKLAIILVSLMTAFTGTVPAQAFPTVSAPKIDTTSNVEQAQYWRHRSRHWRGNDRHWGRDRHWREGRRWDGRRHWRDRDRYYGRYHRRHRGSNVGAVIGGLAAGAIIGGALAQPRYYGGGGSSHANWCYSRYRSYRAYDNTYQPYNGPRRQCVSPY